MNKNNGIWALLPHRGVNAGKSRLSAVLNDAARGKLNRWLLARTLRIVSTWLGDAQRCVVVSPCVHTLALARDAGALALRECAPVQGLNAALAQSAAHAVALGAQRLLILPCDLPRVDIAALQSMAALPVSGGDVVIAPDRHGVGTNALLVDAGVHEFAFGDSSLARHETLATVRGARALRCEQPALAFDLDTTEDLLQWMHSGDVLPDFLAAKSA